jgi:hypothetical protein
MLCDGFDFFVGLQTREVDHVYPAGKHVTRMMQKLKAGS